MQTPPPCEDSMLFYWQREVVQSIKCRGANNCGTHGFVYKPIHSSLPGAPIIVEALYISALE